MKKSILICVLVAISTLLSAQTEISAFNATGSGYSTSYLTDYQCLGVNPANLGWSRNNHTMNIGFFEIAASVYAEPLTRSQVVNDMFNGSFKLDMEGKEDAAAFFTDKRLMGIGSVMPVGFSYQDEKIGGIGFNVRQRFYWNSVLNDNSSTYLFLGFNDIDYFDSLEYNNDGEQIAGYSTDPGIASLIYKGTQQNMTTYIEYNLGYGRNVLDKSDVKLYVGVNLKYLVGYGMTQYYQDDDGYLVGYSALSPVFNVEFSEPTPSQVDGDGYQKVGSGFGVDIGATVEIKEKLRISAAVNDFGSINWDGNVYSANDGSVWKIETGGLDNYNIFEQGQLIVTDNKPDEPEAWRGLEAQKFELPLHMRAGASYRFNEMIEVGVDGYIPFKDKIPGSYEKGVFGFGARYDPARWVQISIGMVTGGEFGTNVPLGFTFYPIKQDKNTWEIGFSTRDMLSYFKKSNPTVSLAFGFLRFSFGAKEASTRYLEEE